MWYAAGGVDGLLWVLLGYYPILFIVIIFTIWLYWRIRLYVDHISKIYGDAESNVAARKLLAMVNRLKW